MLTYKSTQQRFWTTLFVLLCLFATLLPASASHVFAQANSCGGTALHAASVPVNIVHAADEQVNIPAETVNQALYRMAWLPENDTNEFVYRGMQDAFLRYANLAAGTEKYIDFLNRVETELDDHFYNDPSTIVHTMLNTALDTPELAAYVPNIWQRLQQYENKYADIGPGAVGLVAADEIARSARSFQIPSGVVRLAEESFIELYDCAQKNLAVAKTLDAVHSKRINVGIRDNAKTIMAKNPDLPILKEIRDRIGEDGAITISLNELKDLSMSEFAKIHVTLGEMQKTIKDIDERQKVIVDYLSNQVEKERLQELAKKKAAEYQLKLDAAQSGISILSTIAAQIDPKFAKDFDVVAKSSLQVGVAINGWLKAVSGLKGADKLFSLSTVVMTGNVLGAVMNVVGLFGADKPNIDQTILHEIGQLRQQVGQMRTEMHERFDRIDQELNTIYTTMHERFDQIDIQLGEIKGNIREVQQSLIVLDLKLSRIERNNFELINSLGRRPLLEAINGGLGYEQRTGTTMPFQPDFVNFENVLHSWATIHAFDPVNAGPTQRDFSDGQIEAELNAYPLDANINYINGWLIAHGLPGIANKPLPSPRDWLLASRAYTQLALEQPTHMRQIDPQLKLGSTRLASIWKPPCATFRPLQPRRGHKATACSLQR